VLSTTTAAPTTTTALPTTTTTTTVASTLVSQPPILTPQLSSVVLSRIFKQYLTSFEHRIAHLLDQKETMKGEIEEFEPIFDSYLFDSGFEEQYW
jgi:hypothetical protein